MELKGWEGEVEANVVDYKGTKISANLPYKVRFIKPQEEGGKEVKFFCHLVSPVAGCSQLQMTAALWLTQVPACSAQMSWRRYRGGNRNELLRGHVLTAWFW